MRSAFLYFLPFVCSHVNWREAQHNSWICTFLSAITTEHQKTWSPVWYNREYRNYTDYTSIRPLGQQWPFKTYNEIPKGEKSFIMQLWSECLSCKEASGWLWDSFRGTLLPDWLNHPLWPLAVYRHANTLHHLFTAAGVRVGSVALLWEKRPQETQTALLLWKNPVALHTNYEVIVHIQWHALCKSFSVWKSLKMVDMLQLLCSNNYSNTTGSEMSNYQILEQIYSAMGLKYHYNLIKRYHSSLQQEKVFFTAY